ncbi:hypothetical protein [Marinobacter sp. OP 3.4]|uniref:hypothetical protein n=1 Tax=Marinobacter sp. OP 3.4 TaxID=3076501 RepID=UPI002E1AAC7A
MPNSSGRFRAQLTIAKLISFAYDQDDGVVTSLSKSAGNFTLTLDQTGDVSISGSAGNASFSLSPTQRDKIGWDVKWISVRFSATEDDLFSYSVSGKIGALNLSFSGVVDFDTLIMECTGLLCQAARVINADSRFEANTRGAFRNN